MPEHSDRPDEHEFPPGRHLPTGDGVSAEHSTRLPINPARPGANANAPDANGLVEHFFRHESGNMISSLTRFFGLKHIDLVEDMVQSALADALRAWKQSGIPRNPSAWIRKAAKNRVLDALRRNKTFERISPLVAEDEATHGQLDELFVEDGLQDSLLRMLFACCHPKIAPENAIALTLKLVCGFGEQEIAACMLCTHPTVRKRIYRAKRNLIQIGVDLKLPIPDQISERLKTVHNVLYLMFNQGYASDSCDESIRMDVCEEAARLCHLLTEKPQLANHSTHALLALMLFHACRFNARIDQEGALVLLEDQDRRLWDQRLFSRGVDYFRYASSVEQVSTYHLEAAIAMFHSSARRFEDTNWSAVISLYDKLLASTPSPIYELNRAIAIGLRDGPEHALEILHALESDPRMQNSHLLDAALAEFYRRLKRTEKSQQYFESACLKTNSSAEQRLLRKRMQLNQAH